MIFLFLRIASSLIALLAGAVVVILAAPHDDGQARSFLAAPEICSGECLLGIRPGKTRLGEAMQLLQTHPWVESTQLNAPGSGYGQLRWLWSGSQPAWIDARYPGRITFYWDDEEINGLGLNDMPVQTISIYTQIRMFSLQDWFGAPDSGTATLRPDGGVGYSAAYHRPGATTSLSTILPCPTTLMSYWNAPTRLSMSIGHGTSQYVAPVEMVHLC